MPFPERDAVETLLTRQVSQVVERDHLASRLRRGDRLRVKLGIDPTAPDIHLGFAVVLRKLRAFQDLGHTAILIIGDGTALIGDPSGRDRTRPLLSPTAIARNARTFMRQARRILAPHPLEIRWNRTWLARLRFTDLVRLASHLTVARLLEREDFAARLKKGAAFRVHELLYPLAQAYDSVMVRSDVELGGTDQLWNLLTGRDLQRKLGMPPQDVLTVPLLVGLDGVRKMSKSLGNFVGITEKPAVMIGKLMTIPDAVIPDYARLAAGYSESVLRALPPRLRRENPRDVKLAVARDIVALYHGEASAARAVTAWLRVVAAKKRPVRIPTRKLRFGEWTVDDLLVAAGLASSKSAARRLRAQRGVRHNGMVVVGPRLAVRRGDVLQVGKRKFLRLR